MSSPKHREGTDIHCTNLHRMDNHELSMDNTFCCSLLSLGDYAEQAVGNKQTGIRNLYFLAIFFH